MANGHRVVAELGRPETPEETADRKAESSRVYRSSQTTRNLVAALIVTVAVVAVIIFAVPRGSIPEQAPIDPATTAAELSDSLQRTLLVADAPEDWRVNSASLAGDDPGAWTVVYAPPTGFVTIAQGFDADEAWPSQLMGGARSNGTVTVDGIVWDRYQVSDASTNGNVGYALATEAGPDIVVVSGSTDAATTAIAAATVTDQIRALREETE